MGGASAPGVRTQLWRVGRRIGSGGMSWTTEPRALVWSIVAGVAACAHQPSSPAPTVDLRFPGESRHLSAIRQLTFEGNNAEAYFSADGRKLVFQRQEKLNQGCD